MMRRDTPREDFFLLDEIVHHAVACDDETARLLMRAAKRIVILEFEQALKGDQHAIAVR